MSREGKTNRPGCRLHRRILEISPDNPKSSANYPYAGIYAAFGSFFRDFDLDREVRHGVDGQGL